MCLFLQHGQLFCLVAHRLCEHMFFPALTKVSSTKEFEDLGDLGIDDLGGVPK